MWPTIHFDVKSPMRSSAERPVKRAIKRVRSRFYGNLTGPGSTDPGRSLNSYPSR